MKPYWDPRYDCWVTSPLSPLYDRGGCKHYHKNDNECNRVEGRPLRRAIAAPSPELPMARSGAELTAANKDY